MKKMLVDMMKGMPEKVESIHNVKIKKEVSMFVATNTAKINSAVVILFQRF